MPKREKFSPRRGSKPAGPARRSKFPPKRPGAIVGEMVPLDAAPGAAGRLGFTLRVPCGIVAAITPFNFPLNLVCHKVGPALAAGNAVIIKPASDTPLSALKLVEILLEAGTPAEAIACLTGSGATLGTAICADHRVRKISFTGSYEVGERICKAAGMKKVTMELGSNSPVIIMDDADLDKAAESVTSAGFANAGQVCISAQRILTSQKSQRRVSRRAQTQGGSDHRRQSRGRRDEDGTARSRSRSGAGRRLDRRGGRRRGEIGHGRQARRGPAPARRSWTRSTRKCG